MPITVIDPRLEFNGPLARRKATYYIVLHHAGKQTCSVEDVHRWHLERGWAGIGYHYFVRKGGVIYRGRPSDAVGAHCLGYNEISVGICAEGDFEQESMGVRQLTALRRLVYAVRQDYPHARVVGHKDLARTLCPGKHFPLSELKGGREMFKDVTPDAWYYGSIKRVTEAGLMGGYPDGTFKPNQFLTRAEMASILDRQMFRDGIFWDILPIVLPSVATVRTDRSLGSGVCVQVKGNECYVLTCGHVVSGAKEFTVTNHKGLTDVARLKVSSSVPGEDLALLVTGSNFSPITISNVPADLGQPVAVIGSPLGLQNSVTVGVVSGLDRNQGYWFQIDAPINPGNSGGPIINERGQLVGLAVAKTVGQGIEGIGYGITLTLIKNFLKRVL